MSSVSSPNQLVSLQYEDAMIIADDGKGVPHAFDLNLRPSSSNSSITQKWRWNILYFSTVKCTLVLIIGNKSIKFPISDSIKCQLADLKKSTPTVSEIIASSTKQST